MFSILTNYPTRTGRMVDANVQTDPSLPATVVGLEADLLIGERMCKRFGSRIFWGAIVRCYWISGGLFYKVSFDDGDVDIFSADEVLQDVALAQQQTKETPEKSGAVDQTAVDKYFMAMREQQLKRKRDDDVVDGTALHTRRIHLWGQRLYASIYTNAENETFVREMLRTEDGQMGEMEATGQVKVGDLIVAVNHTRVLGMTSSNLAQLIRKHKRPITLTFYRPQHSKVSMQLQEAQGRQDQDRAASSALTTTTQTQPIQQKSVQAQTMPLVTPHATTLPRQEVTTSASALMPSSVSIPRPTSAQPSLMAKNIADQWVQLSSISQTAKEIVRHRLNQNVAARQSSFVPEYPMDKFNGGNVVSVGGVPPTDMAQPHQVQNMQSVADAAAVQLASGFTAPAARSARPMHPAPGAQFEYSQELNQRQHTSPPTSEKVGQNKTVSSPSKHILPSALAEAIAGANKFSAVAQIEPEQRVASSQSEKAQQGASTSSRHPSNQKLTSDQNSAGSTVRGSFMRTSAPTTRTSMLTTRDVEAIARLAEVNPRAAERVMSSSTCIASSASAPADEVQVSTKRKTAGSMSFLSPNDFNIEFSRQNLSTGITANNFVEVKSNVSLVSVSVSRRRLHLTLGVQGTLIAVTSFVLDEFGQPGEVEASGKVFLGDILVRINETYISAGLAPTHVAGIVNTAPRPMTLWFKRASWDILDGKA